MKTSTKLIGIAATLSLVLCALACGSDTEPEEDCVNMGWSLSLDGQHSGEFAVATKRDRQGIWSMQFTGEQSEFACIFSSTQPITSGIHDGFSCVKSSPTSDGAWLAEKPEEGIDLRPTVTITEQDALTIRGNIAGVIAQIIKSDGGVISGTRYIPFQLNFVAANGSAATCGGGGDITPPVVTGCTPELLRSACMSTSKCMVSGAGAQQLCASDTEMIALPSAPDVNACVKTIEFMRDSCQ